MTAKALFGPAFPTLAMGVVAVAIWRLTTGAPWMPWTGVLLTTVPIVVMMNTWYVTKAVARTSRHLPSLTTTAAAGVGLVAWPQVGGSGPSVPLALGLALASAAGVVLYVYWYSVFGREPSAALEVGRTLPSFTVEDPEGRPVDSAELRGAPSVWIFYRGNWCPMCMAQVKEIAARYRELEERGARVRLVSPQPHGHTKELAERFDAPLHFLVDRGNRAAEQLGIASPDGIPVGMKGYEQETVMPTVVITDAEGTILMADQSDNYRLRPEPETFLAVLDEHGALERGSA